MGEVKQTNFRIDKEHADYLRALFEERGWTAAQGFDHIVQVIELNMAKMAVPGRAVEIETFERYMKEILSAYQNSIELCSDAEERIREQFEGSLIRRDKTIDDLHEKVNQLQEDKKAAEETGREAEKTRALAEERARTVTEQMEAAKKSAADQERINAMLTSQLADATDKLDGYDALKASESELRAQVTVLQHKLDEGALVLEHTKERYEIRLADAQATADRCKELEALRRELEEKLKDSERALTDYRKDAERTLTESRKDSERALTECQKEADAALMAAKAEAELDTERAVAAKEREMNEKIREVDRENVRLTAKLEQLQAELERLKSDHGESD